jgi:predicted outer membrane repeat protein
MLHPPHSVRWFIPLLVAMLATLLAGAPPARAASFVVTTLNEEGTGSLSQAILDANATPGTDTITFDVTGTIVLAYTSLIVTDALTIDGPGASLLTLSGTGSSPIIVAEDALDLRGLTLLGSSDTTDGAAIVNRGTISVADSIITGGRAGRYGGGIYNDGQLTVRNSTFSANSAGTEGGAIYNAEGAVATIVDSTFFANDAENGGAIANYGSLTITGSTFTSNTATLRGGAISGTGTVNITNSTFAGNDGGGHGGAISNSVGTLSVTHSTLWNNAAVFGGGFFFDGTTITLRNTIIANSQRGTNCFGTGTGVGSGGNISYPDASCSGANVDPKLGTLANNGGPTETIALLPDSPAIDAALDCSLAVTDQRGVTRPQGAACDIGAFERESTPPTVTINQAATQADPASAEPIIFDVVFSEPVTGFSGSDVVLSGTATGGQVLVRGSGSTYRALVSFLTGSGTVTASIPAGAAQAADGEGNQASTSTDNTVTFRYNSPPSAIGLEPTSVAENQPAGTVVGTLSVSDPDAGDTFSYAFRACAGDNDSFTLDGATLKTAAVFDYETKTSYTVCVRVTDQGGASFDGIVNVAVTDVFENRLPTDILLNANSVAENQPVGTPVGSFTTVDPDPGTVFAYALVAGAGDTDNGSFALAGNGLVTAASFDYETKRSYSIRVRTTDQDSGSFEKAFTIVVTDVPEPGPPKIVSQPVRTAVQGQLYQYDVEATGVPVPQYRLAQAPAGMTIDPITGVISWTPTQLPGAYTVEVRAVVPGNRDVQRFTIALVAPANRQQVVPVLPCIVRQRAGSLPNQPVSYTVRFSYNNPNSFLVRIPFGPNNTFGAVNDRGQPTVFRTGQEPERFSVSFTTRNQNWSLSWTLDGTTVTATRSSPRCRN